MTDKVEISETKPCYVVWVNADRTEGRGPIKAKHVCWSESTARRLAKGQCVQGSDGLVTDAVAVRLDGSGLWLAPVDIVSPAVEDRNADLEIKNKRLAEQRKVEAIEKARAAGLSDDDIKALEG